MVAKLVKVSERVDGFVARGVVFLDIAVDSNFAARMRKGKRRRRRALGGGKGSDYIPESLGWDGGGGRGRRTMDRWDAKPRCPCSEDMSAERGGYCWRLGQFVAPFHNWANFNWACGTWTCGEVDCIPTRGAPLCGTSGQVLARVHPSSRAGFRSLWKSGTCHPTPAMPTTTLQPTRLVFANLHACSGDHCLATVFATPVVKH
jgi:hypothetical protein